MTAPEQDSIAKGGIKLMARDADDLAILSSYLQDAIFAVTEMTWLEKEGSFVAVVNRFKWEEGIQAPHHRTSCGFCVHHVTRAQLRDLDVKDRGRMLDLLTIEQGEDDGILKLIFAGGSAIKLHVAEMLVTMEDIGTPWPTSHLPNHGEV